MICAEKLRLFDEFREAASALSRALTGLNSKTGEELQKAFAVSKAARAKCATALNALQEHKGQHGC